MYNYLRFHFMILIYIHFLSSYSCIVFFNFSFNVCEIPLN